MEMNEDGVIYNRLGNIQGVWIESKSILYIWRTRQNPEPLFNIHTREYALVKISDVIAKRDF